ncbi:hypothetical protein LIER_25466 [Lithospermum erythrorhizon]|uniref:Uncharacterized protein n=1 Tax=Lithospermum erythrorhizon TaxID=34254 RepID=A0AAV3R973_LITER
MISYDSIPKRCMSPHLLQQMSNIGTAQKLKFPDLKVSTCNQPSLTLGHCESSHALSSQLSSILNTIKGKVKLIIFIWSGILMVKFICVKIWKKSSMIARNAIPKNSLPH